jgi:hypothetical protein
MKDRVFISYAHENEDFALKLVRGLREAALAPWIDVREIEPGQLFPDRVNEGLLQASYLLLLLSNQALKSKWVKMEYHYALIDDDTVLITLLTEECPLPPLLYSAIYIDFRNDFEDPFRTLLGQLKSEMSPVESAVTRSGGEEIPIPLRTLRMAAQRCLSQDELDEIAMELEIGLPRMSQNGKEIPKAMRLFNLFHGEFGNDARQSVFDRLRIQQGDQLDVLIKKLVDQNSLHTP